MVVFSIITRIIRENVKNNKIDSSNVFKIGFSLSPFIPVLNTWIAVKFIFSLFWNRFNIKKIREKASKELLKDDFLQKLTGNK
jgi:hypothetical protein